MQKRKMKCPTEKWKEIFKYVPQLTVDAVVINTRKEILLVKRSHSPWKGWWALPGGFVDKGETVERAAVREAMEETGVRIKISELNGVYSNPRRDPRGHVVSVSFIARPAGGKIATSDETSDVRFFPIKNMPKRLAVDHGLMVRDALKKLARK